MIEEVSRIERVLIQNLFPMESDKPNQLTLFTVSGYEACLNIEKIDSKSVKFPDQVALRLTLSSYTIRYGDMKRKPNWTNDWDLFIQGYDQERVDPTNLNRWAFEIYIRCRSVWNENQEKWKKSLHES